jgi:hypothetical protein
MYLTKLPCDRQSGRVVQPKFWRCGVITYARGPVPPDIPVLSPPCCFPNGSLLSFLLETQ